MQVLTIINLYHDIFEKQKKAKTAIKFDKSV
jgi:hypothetical protein